MARLGSEVGQGQIELIDDTAKVSAAVWPPRDCPRRGLGRCDRPLLGHPPETNSHALPVAHDLFAQQLRNCPNLAGGESGRSHTSEVAAVTQPSAGRARNNHSISFVVAGGGFQRGVRYGSTDEFGFKAVEKRVHFHDRHATILHQLVLDHERLTYRHSGRDFSLTDVEGRVIQELLV